VASEISEIVFRHDFLGDEVRETLQRSIMGLRRYAFFFFVCCGSNLLSGCLKLSVQLLFDLAQPKCIERWMRLHALSD
jgi:hypothetical protein